MSLYLTSRDKSSNWWRDKIFVAFHWTFVIIQHYPFLKKYKYFKTNIENKSFWCNKLHSLPRIFSLLKRKGLHPKNNRNINVEQSLEEKRRNVNLCSKLDLKSKTSHHVFNSHAFFHQTILSLGYFYGSTGDFLNSVQYWFCLSSYPVSLTCEWLLLLRPVILSSPPSKYHNYAGKQFCQYYA